MEILRESLELPCTLTPLRVKSCPAAPDVRMRAEAVPAFQVTAPIAPEN